MKSLKFKKVASVSLAFALALGVASIAACAEEDEEGYTSMKSSTFLSMGSTAYFVVSADFSDYTANASLYDLNSAVGDFMSDIEQSISTSISTSYISRFNAAEAGSEVEVDELTYNVLKTAIEAYKLTQGYYNPAVYYSVDLFGFSPRFDDLTFTAPASSGVMPYDRLSDDGTLALGFKEPSAEYVEGFAELASHMSELRLEEREGRYYALKPSATVTIGGDEYSLALNLGGIGKGYAADVVRDMMLSYGFEYGYFTFGASSFSLLGSVDSEQNNKWKLDLSDPQTLAFTSYGSIQVAEAGLSTSGDYEKSYTAEDGITPYCHIIDPFTGRPKSVGIAAVTLAGGSAAMDDALTTALMVMGQSKAVDFINGNLKDYQITMLVRDRNMRCSTVITNDASFNLINSDYTIVSTIGTDGSIILK